MPDYNDGETHDTLIRRAYRQSIVLGANTRNKRGELLTLQCDEAR